MGIKNDLHKAILKIETDYNEWDIEVQMDLLDAIMMVVTPWAQGAKAMGENAPSPEIEFWRSRALKAERVSEEKAKENAELNHLIGEMENGDAIIAKRADRMRKALEFYANPYTYTVTNLGEGRPFGYKIEEDKGLKAREALVDYT